MLREKSHFDKHRLSGMPNAFELPSTDDPDHEKQNYRRRVQRCLIELCLTHGPTTSDAVQKAVPLPDGIHPSNIGLAIHVLVRYGLIVASGVSPTTRPEGTGRLLRKWQIADAQAAARWLIDSVELPSC